MVDSSGADVAMQARGGSGGAIHAVQREAVVGLVVAMHGACMGLVVEPMQAVSGGAGGGHGARQ